MTHLKAKDVEDVFSYELRKIAFEQGINLERTDDGGRVSYHLYFSDGQPIMRFHILGQSDKVTEWGCHFQWVHTQTENKGIVLKYLEALTQPEASVDNEQRPKGRKQGMTEDRKQRAHLLKKEKGNHLDFTKQQLATYVNENYPEFEWVVTADMVNNDFRDMGWDWLRGKRSH